MRMLSMFVLVLGVNLAYGEDDKLKKEMALIEGEWSLVSAVSDGKVLPDEVVKSAKRITKDGVTSVEIDGKVIMKAKFTIDPAKKVKTIDYEVTEGAGKDKKGLGIYEIDGDTFKICMAGPDIERPTAFESKDGSKHNFSVWKRVKKDK